MTLPHSKECDIGKGKDCSCGTEEMVEEFSVLEGSQLRVIVDGDSAWPDLKTKKIHHVTKGLQVAGLRDGTVAGQPSVAIRIDLPDGSVVIAETTLRLFAAAGVVLKAKLETDD